LPLRETGASLPLGNAESVGNRPESRKGAPPAMTREQIRRLTEMVTCSG
jgi:hypothetical protein